MYKILCQTSREGVPFRKTKLQLFSSEDAGRTEDKLYEIVDGFTSRTGQQPQILTQSLAVLAEIGGEENETRWIVLTIEED